MYETYYCANCGKTVTHGVKPDRTTGGLCSMELFELRMRLANSRWDKKTPNNHRNHSWHVVEHYVREHGALTTRQDLQNQLDETKQRWDNIYSDSAAHYAEYQRSQNVSEDNNPDDLFNSVSTSTHQAEETNVFGELKEFKNKVTEAYQSLKSIFSKNK
jgi:hypothetical protein